MQRKSRLLSFIAPMECKPTNNLPTDHGWQYEIKFDGYRCIAIKQDDQIQLYSRRGRRFAHFQNLDAPLCGQRAKSFILDGEIVALDGEGRSDFSKLQRSRSTAVEVHFYAYDLLHLNGTDLLDVPLTKRQTLLWSKFRESGFFHLPKPLNADLEVVVAAIKQFGFEGVVAKQRSARYSPGVETGEWLKQKFKRTDEFVVGGYIPHGNSVESLAVGKYSGKQLMFAASVDDGFVSATRRKVYQAITRHRISQCPFANLPEKNGAHRLTRDKMGDYVWVKPRVIVEIAMNEWTRDKHLRHAEFGRIRDDLEVDQLSPYPK